MSAGPERTEPPFRDGSYGTERTELAREGKSVIGGRCTWPGLLEFM